MEQTENAASQQGSEAQALESLFNKYKDRDDKKKKFLSKEEILAKFFNPRKDTEIFRALPKREGEDLIEEGFFHKVQAGKFISKSTAVYCPAKNNPKSQAIDKATGQLVFDQQNNPVMIEQYCPICAKGKAIKSKIGKFIKKDEAKSPEQIALYEKNKSYLTQANKFEAKRYYIIRGIDRGAEKDGVKFWRFKENFKSQGIHDKLWKPIIQDYYKQTGKLYSNVENGIDLMISVVDNEFNGRTFRDVSAIIPRMPSKLHNDPIIMKSLIDDKTTWREVFKPKKAPGITEEVFLQLAAEEREVGQQYDMRNTPYYDEDVKKWIFPNHPDLETAANTRNQNLDATDEVNIDDDGYVTAATSVVGHNNSLDITEMSTSPSTKPASFKHGSVDIGVSAQKNTADAYDDLPF